MIVRMENGAIKVLLIEDNLKDGQRMQKILEEVKSPSFQLIKAKTLSFGMEILAKGGVDAVLLDNSLPNSSTLDNLVKVQAIAAGSPIIVLSDKDDPVSESEVISMGAQDFLMKNR